MVGNIVVLELGIRVGSIGVGTIRVERIRVGRTRDGRIRVGKIGTGSRMDLLGWEHQDGRLRIDLQDFHSQL